MNYKDYVSKKIVNYNSENSLAFKFRKKRGEKLKELIIESYNQHGNVNIIDVGGTKTYWNIIPYNFLKNHNVNITIVNLPDDAGNPQNDDIFSFEEGDGCNLSNFNDKSFQLAHSNSVIEHVGDWNKIVSFAQEIKRVAEKYYMQTPNYWFPIEPHFVTPIYHWLPKSLKIKLLQNFNIGKTRKVENYTQAKRKVESYNLLSRKKLERLFPDDLILKEKFFFFVKSFTVIKK